jgi:hypothetical protein
MRKIAINLETQKRNASRSLPVKLVLIYQSKLTVLMREMVFNNFEKVNEVV